VTKDRKYTILMVVCLAIAIAAMTATVIRGQTTGNLNVLWDAVDHPNLAAYEVSATDVDPFTTTETAASLTVPPCAAAIVNVRSLPADTDLNTPSPYAVLEAWPDMEITEVTPLVLDLANNTLDLIITGQNIQPGTDIIAGEEGTPTWDYAFIEDQTDCGAITGTLIAPDTAQIGDQVLLTVKAPDGQTVVAPQMVAVIMTVEDLDSPTGLRAVRP